MAKTLTPEKLARDAAERLVSENEPSREGVAVMIDKLNRKYGGEYSLRFRRAMSTDNGVLIEFQCQPGPLALSLDPFNRLAFFRLRTVVGTTDVITWHLEGEMAV